MLGGYKGSNGLGPQGGFWKKAALPGTPLPRALHCLSLALAAISGYAEPPGTGNVDFAVDVPAMLKGDGSTGYVSSVESVDGRLMLTLSTGARVDVSEVSFQNADAAAIFRAAMDYDTDTAAALIVYYEGDMPADVYTEAFGNLYEGGKAGLSFFKAAAGNAYSEYLSDGAAEAAYQAGQAAHDTAGQGGTTLDSTRAFSEDGEAAYDAGGQGGISNKAFALKEGGEVAYDTGSQTEAKSNVLAFGEGGEVTSNLNNPSVPVGQSLSVDEQSGYNEGEAKNFVNNPLDDSSSLKANVKYKSGEFNYNYETDFLGRIEEFQTDDLKLTERADRLQHNPNTPGKLSGDHAGHLAGDRFGGSPNLDNLVSQSSEINLSQYKKIENQWAEAIKMGKRVNVDIRVEYENNNLRPSRFIVRYEIDGKSYRKTLIN